MKPKSKQRHEMQKFTNLLMLMEEGISGNKIYQSGLMCSGGFMYIG